MTKEIMEKFDGKRSEEAVQVGLQIKNSGVGSGDLLSNQRSPKSEISTQSKFPQLGITQEKYKEMHEEKEPAPNTKEQDTLQKSKDNGTFSLECVKFEEDKELEQKASVGISVRPKDEGPSFTFIEEHRELRKDEELGQKAIVDITIRQKDGRSADCSFVTKQKFIQTAQDDSLHQERNVLPEGLLDADQNTTEQKTLISVLKQDIMQIAQQEDNDAIHQEFDACEGHSRTVSRQFNAVGISAEQKVVKTSDRILPAPEQKDMPGQKSMHIIQQGDDVIHPELNAVVDDLMKPTSEINLTSKREETLEETVSVDHLNQMPEQESNEAVQQTSDLTSENDQPIQAFASDPEIYTRQVANPIPFEIGATYRIVLRPPPPGLSEPVAGLSQIVKSNRKWTSFFPSRTRPNRPEIVQFQNRPPVPEEDRPRGPVMGEGNVDSRRIERNGRARLPTRPAGMRDWAQSFRGLQLPPARRYLFEDFRTRCLQLVYGFLACAIIVLIIHWLVAFFEPKYDTGGPNVTSALTNLNHSWNIPVVTLQPNRLLADLDFKLATVSNDDNNGQKQNLDVNMTTLVGDNVTPPPIDKDITINNQRINLDVNITSPLLDLEANGTDPTIDLHAKFTTPTIDLGDITAPTIDLGDITAPTIDLVNLTAPTIDLVNLTAPTAALDDLTTSTAALDDLTTSTAALDDLTTSTAALDDLTTPTAALDDLTTPTAALDDLTTPTAALEDFTTPTIAILGNVSIPSNDLNVNVKTTFDGLYSSVLPPKTDLMDVYVAIGTQMTDFNVNITTINTDLTVNVTTPLNAFIVGVSTPMGVEDINISSTFAEFNVSVVNPVIDLDGKETTLSDLNGSKRTYATKLDNKFFKWILYEKNQAYKNTIFKFK